MLLIGIGLLSAGIGGIGSCIFYDLGPLHLPFILISVLFAITGLILIVAGVIQSIHKSKKARKLNEEKKALGKGVCPNCGLNIAEVCKICPRCGTTIN